MAHIILLSGDSQLSDELTAQMKAGSHSLAAAPDAEKALAAAHVQRPDLLICDLKGGAEREIEFLERLQKERKLMRVPIILLVEGKNYSSILGTYQSDIYAILKKPVEIEHLVVQSYPPTPQTRARTRFPRSSAPA